MPGQQSQVAPRPGTQSLQATRGALGKDRCALALEHRKGPQGLRQHLIKEARVFCILTKTSGCYLFYYICNVVSKVKATQPFNDTGREWKQTVLYLLLPYKEC